MKENGVLKERVWKVGGMYSPAIEKIVYWLEKAQAVAAEPQKSNIAALIEYYKTGDLREFDRYNIGWVKDTVSNVDFVNGFIEDYGDPLGRKASWEGIVNFMDKEACHRTEVISDNAQWFEDHSPVAPAYRKEKVKGVSAKVITVAMLGGDCYPATPSASTFPMPTGSARNTVRSRSRSTTSPMPTTWPPTATASTRSSCCVPGTAR